MMMMMVKDKKITELEIKEITKEMLEIQRSHLNENKGEQLEQLSTINVREQKQNLASTAEEEMEYHQQRNYISELKEKIESAYCHVTQIQINPLNTELNPICCLLALLGAHHFLHVSRIRVKSLTLRLLMSYIYIWGTHS